MNTARKLLPTLILTVFPTAYADDAPHNSVLPEIRVQATRNLSEQIGRSRLNLENIEQQQADNIGSLLDILPGTSMSGSPRPGGQSLNIWGFGDSEDIKITLDGTPKNFEKYRQGSVFIEPELLKQVTVDKGAFDVARGNGGFGGAVRLETKDASDFLKEDRRFGGLVKTSYHTNDEQKQNSAALFARNESNTFDTLFYVSDRRGHNIQRPDKTRFPFSANTQRSYLLKSNFMPSENHKFTLSAVRSEHAAWEPFAAKRDDLAAPTQRDIDRYGLDGAWKRRLLYRDQTDQSYSLKYRYTPDHPLVDLTAQISHGRTLQHDTRPENAAGASAATMGNESRTRYSDTAAELTNTARFDTGSLKHTLKTGFQSNRHVRDVSMFDRAAARQADANFGHYTPAYMPSGKQQQNSLYIQDEIRIGSLTVTPALRYDHIRNQGQKNAAARYNNPTAGHDYRSKTYNLWSPHLGITWQQTPNLLWFADIGRSHRAPVIDEQYEVQSAVSSMPASSRNLKAESLTSVRTGAISNHKNLLAADDNLQIRTTLFRSKGKNEIFKTRGIACYNQAQNGGTAAVSCPAPISNYRNLPGYTVKGIEIEAYYDAPRWLASFSYSALSGKRTGSPRNPWFDGDTWLTDIAPRKATATLGIKAPKLHLTAGWKGEFVRKQDRSPADADPMAAYWALPKSKGYALHGLFAAYKPNDSLTLRLTADNLFNRKYAPYLGESVSGVGRNLKISLTANF